MASAAYSGSDTETEVSEEGSDSGLTVLLNHMTGVQAAEKVTQTEMAYRYSQQLHSMVESYELFINEMKDVTLGSGVGAERMTSGEGDSPGGNGRGGGAPANVEKEGVRKIISCNNSIASGTRPEPSPPSSMLEGAGDQQAAKPCRCSHDIDQLHQKVNAICGFLQMLFSNQVQLLGKSYQDQMELRQRVEELKTVTESADEDLEYLEKEIMVLKKAINSIKVFTNKSVDDKMKTVLEELSHHVDGVNERIGRLCTEVAGMSSAIRGSIKGTNSAGAPGSSGKIEQDMVLD